MSDGGPRTEELLRELSPLILGTLVRRFGGFDICEDAVQEALLAAALQWERDGIPDNPRGWLFTVAARRRTEMWRNESARARREEANAVRADTEPAVVSGVDDTLTLLVLCAHPELTDASRVALTLRAVGGLTTVEIARAFLVPESTVAQRISRAKARIKSTGAQFEMPAAEEYESRLAAVLQVLYLIFNEGYTASSGAGLHRVELSTEAMRLTHQVRTRLADDGEVAGLLALMLLSDARRPARTGSDGGLVPLAEQDRSRWDAASIVEGRELISWALSHTTIGPYQLQAAIAAVHADAADSADTDWPQILALYDLLQIAAPGPMVTLNRIVAAAMVHGPVPGLARLAESESDPALRGHHRVAAVRAHLLEATGERPAAREAYRQAARLTLSLPEKRFLEVKADQLEDSEHGTQHQRPR